MVLRQCFLRIKTKTNVTNRKSNVIEEMSRLSSFNLCFYPGTKPLQGTKADSPNEILILEYRKSDNVFFYVISFNDIFIKTIILPNNNLYFYYLRRS